MLPGYTEIQPVERRNCVCCGPCVGICGAIIITVSYIIYSIYAIIALLDNTSRDIKAECSSSDIWAYLLMTLLFGNLNHLYIIKLLSDNKLKSVRIIIYCIFQYTFISYGLYEIWWVDCADNTNLVYKMCEIYIYASIVLTTAFVSIICVVERIAIGIWH